MKAIAPPGKYVETLQTELGMQEKLNEALINVARTAHELSDDASLIMHGDKNYYSVSCDVMAELREAIKEWKEATQAYLESIKA